MRCPIIIILCCLVLAIATRTEAAPDPVQKCYLCKLNAAAKAHACVLRAAGKEAKRNKSQFDKIFLGCPATLVKAFTKCETKAERKGSRCPTSNDAGVVWQRVLTDAAGLVESIGAPSNCCSSVECGSSVCVSSCWEGVFGITPDYCTGRGGTFIARGFCNGVPVCEASP